MNKAVMISIHPKWCELIANGKKTVEVRKTKPKLETPFKVYIYETKAYDTLFGKGNPKKLCVSGGRVIGEFVCDYIDELHKYELTPQGEFHIFEKAKLDLFLEQSCLSYGEICDYRKNLPCYKPLYGWHISTLVIYDKPKELSEFKKPDCACPFPWVWCPPCDHCDERDIKTPPQSWCYVEEQK